MDNMRKIIPRHELNESKRATLFAALSLRLTLSHGPPDSGRSATAAVQVNIVASVGALVLPVAYTVVDNVERTNLQSIHINSNTKSTKLRPMSSLLRWARILRKTPRYTVRATPRATVISPRGK